MELQASIVPPPTGRYRRYALEAGSILPCPTTELAIRRLCHVKRRRVRSPFSRTFGSRSEGCADVSYVGLPSVRYPNSVALLHPKGPGPRTRIAKRSRPRRNKNQATEKTLESASLFHLFLSIRSAFVSVWKKDLLLVDLFLPLRFSREGRDPSEKLKTRTPRAPPGSHPTVENDPSDYTIGPDARKVRHDHVIGRRVRTVFPSTNVFSSRNPSEIPMRFFPSFLTTSRSPFVIEHVPNTRVDGIVSRPVFESLWIR